MEENVGGSLDASDDGEPHRGTAGARHLFCVTTPAVSLQCVAVAVWMKADCRDRETSGGGESKSVVRACGRGRRDARARHQGQRAECAEPATRGRGQTHLRALSECETMLSVSERRPRCKQDQ